jgi:hypothetical protein
VKKKVLFDEKDVLFCIFFCVLEWGGGNLPLFLGLKWGGGDLGHP